MNWKAKLTSRKFWVALASFVSMMLTAFFGKSDSEAAQVAAIIMAGASVVAYVIGEGLVDAADAKNTIAVSKPPDDAEGSQEIETESQETVTGWEEDDGQ